jgi:ERCC4-type nuclease
VQKITSGDKKKFWETAMPGTLTVSAGKALTVNIKAVKAKCEENQIALDRLQEQMVKAQANPNQNHLFFSLKRAVKSLQDCPHPITTQKQANELKHVGPKIARIIVPHATGAADRITQMEGAKRAARKVAPSMKRQDSSSISSVTSSSARADASTTTTSTSFAPSAKEMAYNKAKKDAQNLELPPRGPWKVILLIDGREHKSKQIVSQCKQSGIPCEERHLPIGDMAWIARCTLPKTSEMSTEPKPIEVMIGTIIERKDVNDLVSSLFGTRYSEQRLRLSKCGLPQVLFLVEGDVNQVQNCPPETLQMTMMETRVHLGFQVVRTKNLVETVQVLKGLHRRLVQRTFPEAFDKDVGMAVPLFVADSSEIGRRLGSSSDNGRRRNRRPSSLLEMVFDTTPKPPLGTSRFITYAELKAKVEFDREQGTRAVQAITLAMLKQIPSISQKKCTAIAQEYPTMNRLIETLCFWEGNQQKLMSEIPLEQNRTIGPVSGAEIVYACCTLGDGSLVSSSTEPEQPVKKKAKHTNTSSKSKPSSASSTEMTTTSISTGACPASTVAMAIFPIDKGSFSDDSCLEVAPIGSFISRKRLAVEGSTPLAARKTAASKIPSFMTTVDDSLLMSSPEDFLSKPPSKPSKLSSAREAAAAAAEKRAATANRAAAASSESILKMKSSPLVIDIADSDNDTPKRSAVLEMATAAKTRHESDLQRAIRLSMLDTPSTASSAKNLDASSGLTTPGMLNGHGKKRNVIVQKLSKDTGSDEVEVDDSLLFSSPEQETSLRERLANRLDREVIEIDLD